VKTFAWLCLALGIEGFVQAVDFETEIMPVLTKAGCNSGACHGAAAGRGGFHLSLLGSNPSADYDAIVHELEGRRTNQAHPEKSLILAKPTGYLDHGGDVVLDEAGPDAKRLVDWIRSGVSRGTPKQLTSLAVEPSRFVAATFPTTVSLKAIANFDHGLPTDVSDRTVFSSADLAAVEIEESEGNIVARVKRPGQHVVLARFLNRVVPIQLNVPLSDKAIDLSSQPRGNWIDEEILQLLSELRIPISPPSSSNEWLRRVTLDLTGRLPEPATVEEFVSQDSPDVRSGYVDALLASDAFSDYWTLKFSKLLRFHSLPNEKQGLQAYSDWLRGEIHNGTGLDRMARQLLTATGDSHFVGPANFGRMVSDARDQAELVGQFFMGTKLGCANCHNHPLDKWTQDDYHGLAAVFSKLERGREVRLTSRGAVTNLRTSEPAVPRIPGLQDLDGTGDHRVAFADWLLAKDNSYFARATVNRLWQAMFGRGLVEPADDLRDTNPPTHPELLHKLAENFVHSDYDIRHTLKNLAMSHTYARSGAILPGNASDDRFYSHAYGRELHSEVLLDAISDVTGVPSNFEGHALGVRAVTILDPLEPVAALDILGRCSKAKGCDDNGVANGGLPAKLHLLNGDLLNRKLIDSDGRLNKLLEAGQSDETIVREYYMRAIGRNPTESESTHWCQQIKEYDVKKRRDKMEDFVWSLLNSRSFLENH